MDAPTFTAILLLPTGVCICRVFMRYALLNSVLLVMLLCSQDVAAQSIQAHEYTGQAFGLKHYERESLPNLGQNWSVAQDDRGVIYVANSGGILEYDAAGWRIIHVPDSATVFSVGKSTDGVIHAGARDEFGYLIPDETGTLVYRSLLPFLPESDTLRFGEIWNTEATSNSVFFQSNSHLFRWDGSEITTWRSSERLHTSFVVNDTFYVKRDGKGILAVKGDSLSLVPGTERFANHRVVFMGAIDSTSLRIYVQQGLDAPLEAYQYDSNGWTTLQLDQHLNNDVETYTFYHGSVLPSGYVALATLSHGVFLLDPQGNLIEVLDVDRAVNEDVNATFVDNQGGLWLAHNGTGVTYMASPAALSSYGVAEGLKGAVNDVLRHKGRLFVATDDGLFVLKDRIGKAKTVADQEHFQRIKISGIPAGVFWDLPPQLVTVTFTQKSLVPAIMGMEKFVKLSRLGIATPLVSQVIVTNEPVTGLTTNGSLARDALIVLISPSHICVSTSIKTSAMVIGQQILRVSASVV